MVRVDLVFARRLGVTVLSLAVIGGVVALMMPASPVEAAGPAAFCPCPNPGVFTGTDPNGVFQKALENAIAAAEACAPCCDFIVSYEVVDTSGRRGGFAGFNDITVRIIAKY